MGEGAQRREPAAHEYRHRFERALARCQEVARESFEASGQVFAEVGAALARFDETLAATEEHFRKMTDSHDAELRAALAPIFEEKRARVHARHRDLLEAHERRRQSLDSFTVMFFGKTMAGKSTTIEALTAGSGETIGDGGPDYTRDVRTHSWRGLALIDTPGLLGFRPELRGVAEALIDRTDVIAMLVSDDSIEPMLFQRMREIRGQNKRLAILLNVKGANRDLLDHQGEAAYDEREIGEQTEFIRARLAEFFPDDNVPILAFCANVAFEATREADPRQRLRLWHDSRIDDVIAYLTDVVERDGLAIRATAAYDSLCHFTQSIAEETEVELPGLRHHLAELRRKRGEARRIFDRLHRDVSSTFAGLRQHFLDVQGRLDLEVDAILDGERTARGAFEGSCRWDDVRQKAEALQSGALEQIRLGVDRFRDVLVEDLAVASELPALEFGGLEIDADALASSKLRVKVGTLVRRVGVPAVRLAGWIAGLFTEGWGVLAGEIAAEGLQRIGRDLEEGGHAGRRRAHQSLRDRMRQELWSNHSRILRELEAWLAQTLGPIRQSIADGVAEFERATEALLGATEVLVSSLHAARHRLAFQSYDALLRATHPAFRGRDVRLLDATQWMHYRTKLVVPAGAKGFVLGKDARHMHALRSHTGNAIDVVEAHPDGAIDERFVAQALRPAAIEPSNVALGDRIVVRATGKEIGKAFGRGRRNLLLASEIVGRPIDLVGQSEGRSSQAGDRRR